MDSIDVLEYQWPYLLSYLPSSLDLEATARTSGALRRRRGIGSAQALLRLALAYGFCGLSLRQVAAWAEVAGVGVVSDVAVLNRLRAAGPWLGQILGALLAERTQPKLPADLGGLRVRLVDATTVSIPGSRGIDWRVHLGFDLEQMAIDHIEVTDGRGGETLRRFPAQDQELLIGDRGYAHRAGMNAVREAGGHFLIRLNWQNVPLQQRSGEPFNLLGHLRQIPEAEVQEFAVQSAPDPKKSLPAIPARLVAVRKSEAAATNSRRAAHIARSKKSKTPDPRTLESASYTFVLTSLPDDVLAGQQILELYRFRWQIELAFKRLKSVLDLDVLQAKDPELCRCALYAKLLAALLLDDFSDRFLSFSPWGFSIPEASTQPMENPPSSA